MKGEAFFLCLGASPPGPLSNREGGDFTLGISYQGMLRVLAPGIDFTPGILIRECQR